MSARFNAIPLPKSDGVKHIKIAVELPWNASAHMGTGAYSETMVRALALAAPWAEIHLIAPQQQQRAITFVNVEYHCLEDAGLEGDLVRQVALPIFLEHLKPDCLFAPATLLPAVKICPMVATVHDLTFLTQPELYSPGLVTYLKRNLEPTLRSADQLIAISMETKNQLRELLGIPDERITVIEQPVRQVFSEPYQKLQLSRILSQHQVQPPYFFHVSNLGPHKQVLWLVEAFAEFKRQAPRAKHKLIICGGGIAPNQPPDFMAHAVALRVEAEVKYLGRVDDETLKALYQGCDAFLFPSLAEGWGLPVAEANALGARIIASPHVPAAANHQRFGLNVSQWASAMLDPAAGKEGNPVPDFKTAGKRLAEVLTAAKASQKGCLPPEIFKRIPKMQHSMESAPARIQAPPPSSPWPPFGITGCTIVRNGVKLAYPFMESIATYAPICDEIILCWDPTSEDRTVDLVQAIAKAFSQVRLLESAWDMSNRTGGSELARQTQVAFDHCKMPWTLYVQADEAIHEKDHQTILALIRDSSLDGVTFERRSFLRRLDAEIADHRAQGLMRLFRTGLGASIGDAMHCVLRKENPRVLQTNMRMFNYSRMGEDSEFVARSMNLHRFYHDDAWLHSRNLEQEKAIESVPYLDRHPGPIEVKYRRDPSMAATRSTSTASVSAHYIAREIDEFGTLLFESSLLALKGYADQIVVVDNGLCDLALDMLHSLRQDLPLTVLNGKAIREFDQLRNLALDNTAPGISFIHKIDSDEVYFPGGLSGLKQDLAKTTAYCIETNLIHFMIEPQLVEFSHPVRAVIRNSPSLRWTGAVHEKLAESRESVAKSAVEFLHFGYCRPQWQTLLKWLQYAYLELGHIDHFKYQFVDGVKRSWFSQGRTPETILEFKRERLERYPGKYPESVRKWLEQFHESRQSWKDWVASKGNPHLWSRWLDLKRQKESWEDTLDPMLQLYTQDLDSVLKVRDSSMATSTPKSSLKQNSEGKVDYAVLSPNRVRNEFRRGFSILMPSWNNLPYLKKCVESIRKNSTYPHEVIVHINEGSDGTVEWAQSNEIKYTFTPENRGVCIGVNQAATMATRDIVMYMNDDMVVLPQWDRLMVDYAEAHRIDQRVWLSSTLIEPTGNNGDFIAPANYGTSLESFEEDRLLADLAHLRTLKPDLPGTTWAPNLMYKEIFDKIGGFTEAFSPGFGSDPDLAKKVWDIGGRVFVSVGASLVYHFQCKVTSRLQALGLNNIPYQTFFDLHRMSIPQFLSFLKANSQLAL